jgi:predicted esterase
MAVEYHEDDHGHWIDPEQLAAARTWLETVL